jgi:hypothetical protein
VILQRGFRGWSFGRLCGRRAAIPAGVVMIGAASLAATAGTATAATASSVMYMHSASSGELAGGRLTLHGVGHNVTWMLRNGRTGVDSISHVHGRLFAPKKPATALLHIAGHRGGEELAFRLSDPRYSAARRTVSYRAVALAKETRATSAPTRVAAAAPQRFGAASLSVVPHASVATGDNGGRDCVTGLSNQTEYLLQVVSASNWDTDTWASPIPGGEILGPQGGQTWESWGGWLRGCSSTATWKYIPGGFSANPPSVTFTVSTGYQWGGDWGNSCTSSDPQYYCFAVQNQAGLGSWSICGPNPPFPQLCTATPARRLP